MQASETATIYPASPTPLGIDGGVDGDALVRLMHRNLAEGADGFFIGGSSAECFLLGFGERVQVFEAAATLRAKTHLIAHVGALSTTEAIAFAREAKRLGYEKIAATPPFYYHHSPDDICGYYFDLCEAASMPVLLYNFPGNTGVVLDLSHPAYRALLQSGVIWGVKHTNRDVYELERLLAVNPALRVYNGYDETMVAALAAGVHGSIGSTFSFMLSHYREIMRLFAAGSLADARALQADANDIMQGICAEGLIPAIKYILDVQGCPVGEPRAPFHTLDAAARVRVDRLLKEKLFDGG